MIPCIFSPTRNTRDSPSGRDAERALYNALERINNLSRAAEHFRERMHGFVFHGGFFNSEEIDFIFLTIHGLVIFECKGVKKESQAKRDYLTVKGQLERKVRTLEISPGHPIFKVVAFPLLAHCDIKNEDDTLILFKQDLVDIKDWLRRSAILRQKIAFSDYTSVVTKFLMEFHQPNGTTFNARDFKRRAISGCSDNLERVTKFYTKEQAELLNHYHSEDIWITGAAGTGKTFVLKDRVKLLAEKYSVDDNSKKILVITYNRPIKTEIE